MNQLDYLDFDVLFEKSGEEYQIRVLNSPSGQASARFSLPFSPFEVENLLLRIGRTRKGVRRLESPEMEASRAFGGRLFSAVFNDEVLACLRSSLNASYRKGMGLRLRMRLSNTPELVDLPWEFLFDPTRNQFLVLSVDTPVVRYLDLQQEIQPLAVTPPINVLAMIASPVDYPPLDVAHEWEKLNEALGDLIKKELVSLTRLEKADLASLQRALRRGQYHVFHFIGHGGFDNQAQDGVLLTEGDSGRGRPVSGYDLGTLLHDHRSLRLAVLNACEGARTSLTDPFAGTAQSLVQNGIPAVIAMQFEITDEAAILLAHEFYGALADGYPVDASLAEARKAIFAQGNDVEWATPVLYLRAADAAIFQIESPAKTAAPPAKKPPKEKTPGVRTPTEKPPVEKQPVTGTPGIVSPGVPTPGVSPTRQAGQVNAEVNRLYTLGLSAFWLDDWEQAIQNFEAVLQLQPDHTEAASRLETARRNLELQRLDQQAGAAEAAEEWGVAATALEQLARLSPSYKDAQARLDAARLKGQLAELYAQARQLSQAGEGQAVVKVFSRITDLDPDAPDPEGLLANAKEQLAIQQKQAELQALYNQAVKAMDAGQWEGAAGLLRQVEVLQPGYEQAGRLLLRAEAELARVTAPVEVEAAVQAPAASAPVEATAEAPALPAQETEAPVPAGEWRAAARLALRPALWLAGGWFLAGLAAYWWIRLAESSGLIERLADLTNYAVSYELIGYLQFILIFGPLSGLVIGILLHRTALHLTRRQILGLIAAWTAVGLLPAPFFSFGGITTAYILAWTLAGALGGLATYAVLRRGDARLNRTVLVAIVLGWAIALALGEWYIWLYDQEPFHGWLHSSFGDFPDTGGRYLFISLGNAVSGFIGGLATFAAWYRQSETKEPPAGAGPDLPAPAAVAEPKSLAQAPPASQSVVTPTAGEAAGLLAALPQAMRPALWMGAGWFLVNLIAVLFALRYQGQDLVSWISNLSGGSLDWYDIGLTINALVAGLLSGAVLGIVVNRNALHLARRHFLALIGIWTLISLIGTMFYIMNAPMRVLLWFITGALGGWLTYAVLRRADARFDRQALIWIALGWAIGIIAGSWLVQSFYGDTLYVWLYDKGFGDFLERGARWLFFSLGGGVAGFIGGLATFAAWFRISKVGD